MNRTLLIMSIHLVAGTLVVNGQTPPTPARIVGAVQTPTGAPIARARVHIAQVSDTRATTLALRIVIHTGNDGVFHAVGLPPGTFRLCAESPDPDLLHDCVWGPEKRVTVAQSQTVAIPPIRLAAGVDLFVRVKDPTGKRAELEGTVPGADLLLAVRTPRGVPAPILQAGKDKGGFDHHILVPAGTDLQLVAFSKVFALADERDIAVEATRGHQPTIRIPANSKQHKIVLTVTGLN